MKIKNYKSKFMLILTLFLGVYTVFSEDFFYDFQKLEKSKTDEGLKDFDEQEKVSFEKPKEFEKLEPLKANETLEYEHNSPRRLTIFKSNGTEKQVYYESLNTRWGGYKISEDKKYMIFFWDEIFRDDDSVAQWPLYYLDGNKGELKLIGNYRSDSALDRTGKYLLYEKVLNSGKFAILNLQTGKVEKNLTWKLLNKEQWIEYGGLFCTLRATDNKYDFSIEFYLERNIIARGHVRIKDNKIITEYDYSNLTGIEIYERQHDKSP